MTKETREALLKMGETASGLVLGSEKVQSVNKTRMMDRFFRQQVHGVFRHPAVKKIRSMVAEAILHGNLPKDFARNVEINEKFFVTEIRDDPYLLFGALAPLEDTKDNPKKNA